MEQGPGRFRLLTSPLRLLPDFLIIGAQRCGTTSLYRYLTSVPYIYPAVRKEIHFFDVHYHKGLRWYKAHFPMAVHKLLGAVRFKTVGTIVTGESSPYYLFHPLAPARVRDIVPQVRLIVLLRNPVDRAYSHYHLQRKLKVEPLSFEEAIAREEERLAGEREKLVSDKDYYSFNHQHYSYLSRGIYIDQLKRWSRFFPREQMLVLRTEDLETDPSAVLRTTSDFLGLPYWQPKRFIVHNRLQYPPMSPQTREYLQEYFRPHNKALYEYLGRDLGWDQ